MAKSKKNTIEESTGIEEWNFEPPSEENSANQESPTEQTNVVPKMYSEEWENYVLSNLRNSEVTGDGFPRAFGLRRLVQDHVGTIISTKTPVVSVVPIENGSRAVTVSAEIQVRISDRLGFFVDGENVFQTETRTFTGTADCIESQSNIFARHPAASAETKALSRAYKMALGLTVLTAEEKISGYDQQEDLQSMAQSQNAKPAAASSILKMIKGKISTLRPDAPVEDTVKEILEKCEIQKDNLDQLDGSEARVVWSHINDMQQTLKEDVPF